jgi:hypothetical protein
VTHVLRSVEYRKNILVEITSDAQVQFWERLGFLKKFGEKVTSSLKLESIEVQGVEVKGYQVLGKEPTCYNISVKEQHVVSIISPTLDGTAVLDSGHCSMVFDNQQATLVSPHDLKKLQSIRSLLEVWFLAAGRRGRNRKRESSSSSGSGGSSSSSSSCCCCCCCCFCLLQQ